MGGLAAIAPIHEQDQRSIGEQRREFRGNRLRLPLMAGRGPLRRAMAVIAGRIVSKRAWERLGFARIRDYGVEQLALSGRQIHDLARIDSALLELPKVSADLIEGRLSWTRARLIASVATSTNESEWLERARKFSVAKLQELINESRRSDSAFGTNENREKDGLVSISCSPRTLQKLQITRQLARRVAGEKLTAWEAMELVAAEALSSQGLGLISNEDPPTIAPRDALSRPEIAGDRADLAPTRSTPGENRRYFADLISDIEHADAFELDRRMRLVLGLHRSIESRMGPILLDWARNRRYVELGYRTFTEFVREHLEMSPRKVRALLRLERVGRTCPGLIEAYRAGQLSWVQAHQLISVVLIAPNRHRDWVAWAQRVSVRRLEEDVESALTLFETDPEEFDRTGGLQRDRSATNRQTRALSPSIRETSSISFTAPADSARFLRGVIFAVRARLLQNNRNATLGDAVEWMLDHAIATWTRGTETLERTYPVFTRDGWRCMVPGCSSFRNLHEHHIVFRSMGGSDELSNRISVCAWHHLRGIHAGTVRCSGTAPNKLRFELGIRRERRSLLVYKSGDLIE